jgi:ATP-dependent helicase/nuclease subunit A
VKEEKAYFDAMKERIRSLLETIQQLHNADAVHAALIALRTLPATRYTEAEWNILGAIVRLLPRATAHLWAVFGQEGECDFTEISQAAVRALGEDDAPTDLALALDYRIRHLLVDEFQDTSFAQFSLLEKLTRGWQAGDGRTLFVVGDPMQSIYRFREAEVDLFLRAQAEGIGSVALTPLTLTVNFRSESGIVNWVNETFSALMPAEATAVDIGIVPYSASVAFHEEVTPSPAVRTHWQLLSASTSILQPTPPPAEALAQDDAPAREAEEVVNIIRRVNANADNRSIAILVRNRSHLVSIVPALTAAEIAFRAVDIDPLCDRPVVQDLWALARALLHPADRLAWLSILRAPWCGMGLHELATLTGGDAARDGALQIDEAVTWATLHNEDRLTKLSTEARARAEQLRDALTSAIQMVRRAPLRDVVESAWLALDGPFAARDAASLDDAMAFLDLLEDEANRQSGGVLLPDYAALERRLAKLYAASRASVDASVVDIMTIHKAKGLEWDVVLLPGLHRISRGDSRKLLAWTETANAETGARHLLLAPIRESGTNDETDSIYRYITNLERTRERHEDVRLMYVAATRAVRELHLLGAVTQKKMDVAEAAEEATAISTTAGAGKINPPKQASLLSSLWPALAKDVEAEVIKTALVQPATGVMPAAAPAPTKEALRNTPVRLVRPLDCTPLPPSIDAAVPSVSIASAQIDFEWASDTARHVGTIVHGVLQVIAEDGLAVWSVERVRGMSAQFAESLIAAGVAASQCGDAAARIVQALTQTLDDERGRWILSAHQHAQAEWRISGLLNGALTHIAIDRSFVDTNGTRWIIDYKTGDHKDSDVEEFIDNEQKRYRAQLETYATLLAALNPAEKDIKLGLYFPLLKAWREWSAPDF